jgi:MYXO-CTERM domain-containing protein
VFTHPGPAGSDTAFTVVEWKSPVEGNATVSATLTDADVAPGGSGFQFWIRHNGEGLVVGSVVEGGTESVSLSDVAVLQGESLYLVVGPGTSHSWDSTHLVSLTVSVPEPPVVSSPASSPWSLAILVAIGAAAVPVLRRRRA